MCSIIDANFFFSYNGSHMQPASLVSKSIQTTKSMIKAGVVLISILGVVGFFMRSIQGETRKIPSMAEGLIRLEKKQEVQIRAIEAYDKKNKTTYALISRSMTCKVSGYFCENSYGFDREKFKDSYLGSAAGLALLPLMNPPASGTRYVAQKMNDAGIVPKALAASSSLNRGVGFASIDPLLPIWKVMRSVALMILVVLTLLSGFFVMFRYKVNAQTSISIENAIPKLLITMILITFSFAIAGFLIDLMYIVIGALMSFAGSIQFGNMKIDQGALYAKYFDAGPDDLLGLYTGDLDVKNFCTGAASCTQRFGTWAGLQNVLWKLPEALLSIAGAPIELILRIFGGLIALVYILDPITKMLSTLAPSIGVSLGATVTWTDLLPLIIKAVSGFTLWLLLGWLVVTVVLNVIIGVFIFLAAIYQAIKLFMALLTTYIRILLLIVFAPVLILTEAIPGSSAFKDWFRSLLAEVMVFPILIGIFLAGSVLIFAVTEGLDCGLLNPQTQDCMLIQLPFLRGIEAEAFGIILGMALLFMMPELTMKAKKMINPKESPFPNFSLGTFFNGAKPMLGFGLGAAAGVLSLAGKKSVSGQPMSKANLISDLKARSPALQGALDKLFPEMKTSEDYLKELLKRNKP